MRKNNYIVGLDLGSISVNAVVINQLEEIVYEKPYTRHDGKAIEKARQMLKDIAKEYQFDYVSVTG
ncbi:MAG: hypothetical protein U9R03_04585, partial [Candidatus Aerophobetes bacterium]|nr:hypothetical protein [Candidatus Aerophobetes bacterium]